MRIQIIGRLANTWSCSCSALLDVNCQDLATAAGCSQCPVCCHALVQHCRCRGIVEGEQLGHLRHAAAGFLRHVECLPVLASRGEMCSGFKHINISKYIVPLHLNSVTNMCLTRALARLSRKQQLILKNRIHNDVENENSSCRFKTYYDPNYVSITIFNFPPPLTGFLVS